MSAQSFIFVLIVSILGSQLVSAQPGSGGVRLIRDPHKRYSPQQVLHMPGEPIAGNRLEINEGFYRGTVWVVIHGPFNDQDLLLLDNPLTAEVDYYHFTDSMLSRAVYTGYKRPASNRDIVFPTFLFHVPPKPNNHSTIVLRLAGEEVLMTHIRILNRASLNKYFLSTAIISFSIIGALIALFLFYLIIFSSLRDNIYLYYALYSIFIILMILRLNGLWDLMFAPIALFSSRFIAIFEVAPAITTSLFALHFLQVKQYYYRWYKIFYFIILLQFLTIPFIFLEYNQIALICIEYITIFAYMPITIGLAFSIWLKKKFIPAKYYLLSVVFLFTGGLTTVLRANGVFQSDSILVVHAMELGVVAEMLMLALGVSKRFENFRAEKEAMQRENLKLLAEQASTLERQVSERTHALQHKTEEISRQRDEINRINATLEETVETRTRQLRQQNHQLREYAHLNSHKVRGPLARILGLVEIWRLGREPADDALLLIEKSAVELDDVIREMNDSLSVDIKESEINSRT